LSDTRELLRRGVEGFEPMPDAFERVLIRRDRKRRNQRIAAGVVGIAVFVSAVWVVTTGGSLDRSETPPAPGGPGPSVGSSDTPEVDYLLDLNTGEESPLPKAITRLHDAGGEVGQFAASRDGSRLAFVKTSEDGSPQIFVAGIDGTGVRQLTHHAFGVTSPAWSPDGTTIAYAKGSPIGTGRIFVVDVASGTTRALGVRGSDPQFTPDGSSVFYSRGSPAPTPMTVPAAGGEGTVLIEPGPGLHDAFSGSISPDGSQVTYLGSGAPLAPDGSPLTFRGEEIEHAGPGRFVSNLDGSGFGLLPGGVSNPAGTWSPDGTRIVCSGEDGNSGGGVIVVNVATGTFNRVAEGRIAVWVDDHTLLVEA
jgi:Tol biopolymer transport system component